jgi:hypothetical protein
MTVTGSEKGLRHSSLKWPIPYGIEDPDAKVSRRVSRARRSPSAHPAREMWTLRRRGGGEQEGEVGADFSFNLPPIFRRRASCAALALFTSRPISKG